jgi:hypothetical protein
MDLFFEQQKSRVLVQTEPGVTMYQLHYFPSNANAASHMVLEEFGQKYDLVLVDRAKNAQKSKAYLKINPNGRIPTLVDGDLVTPASASWINQVERWFEADPARCSHLRHHPRIRLARVSPLAL